MAEEVLDSDAVRTSKKGGIKRDSDEIEKKEVAEAVPFYKLFCFADSTDYALMLAGTLTAVGSGMSMPLMAVIFGELVDTFGKTSDTKILAHEVFKVSLKFVYLAMGSGLAAFSHVVCWTVTGERQAARIRSLYLNSILRQDIGYFDKGTNTGEIIQSISSDTVVIQDAIGEKVGKFMQLAATFLGGFVIAFMKGWLLALVLISSIPPLAISAAAMTIFMTKLGSRGQTAYSVAATVVEQTVSSIRTVVSFAGERQAIAKFDKSLDKAYTSVVQEGLAAGLGIGIFMLVLCCNSALALWFGSKMIIEKEYTGGDVLNVIIAILTGSFSLGQASPCLSAFAGGQVAARKLFDTISRKPEIDSSDTDGKKLDDIRGDIELRDVYFSYPSRPDEHIFHGFSLSIPSGTTAALVGASGSGKSTVVSLIERFYDPQVGEVLIDGINLKEFQLRWIRAKIGLVSQEPVLFASSIKDNIAYGKDSATLKEIVAASRLANAAKFISELPQGLDTLVGVRGTQLSGGQKQRIAIARAVLKDPRILLLDEATSALDAESERTVQKALDRVMINRTTLIVAHRLSTVRNADMISVIQHGKIVQQGSHSELVLDPEGAYFQLIQLQERKGKSEQQSVTEQHYSCYSSSVSNVVSDSKNTAAEPKALSSSLLETKTEISIRRLAYLNKPEVPELVVGSLAAVAIGLVLPALGVIFSSTISSFYEPVHDLREDSEFWASMFVILGLATLLAVPVSMYSFSVAGCKLVRRVQILCFEKMVQMEISWFDKLENSSGAISSRLSVDALSVRGLLGDTLALLVQNSATAIAGLVIAFKTSWQLAFIILLMLPLIGLNGYLQMKFMSGFSADSKELYEDASQVACDAVGNIRTVASFCAEEKVMQLYQNKGEGCRRAGIRQGLISGIGFGLSMLLLFWVYAATFYAGARLVEAGNITFAGVFRVFFSLSMAAIGISQSGSPSSDSAKAMKAAASVFALLDQKSRIDSSDESGITCEAVKGDIEFSHVSFKYPSRPDVQILGDFCLVIPSGKTVALVGESGSGKSTVLSLLQRFYDPDSGQVMLDGVQIQKLKLKWLRQQMGLVSQEPILFNDTIRGNITYGLEGNITEAEIFAASELANAHKFISGLQQGYDTIVGEQGIQLSGGQKQRVAIARAIVRAPKVLLLDEATSALDAESEKAVQDALNRVMVERTTVLVAHRLSTIRCADSIAVVKNGVISERGKHDALINIKDGNYASLVAHRANISS